MANVALFIDYENLSFVLQKREHSRINHRSFGEELRRFALQFGTIDQSVMWAEWERYLPTKRQDQSAQAAFTALGFDCLYLLKPSDRSYIEQAIIRKLPHGGENLQRVILVSGDYLFPELIAWLHVPVTLINLAFENHLFLPPRVEQISLYDVVDRENTIYSLQTPHGLEPAAFYIWVQRVLQDELHRRNWQGMSFHMFARLMVERKLCDEDMEAQFYINQAVREGFLERMETELPTGVRVLLRSTIVERNSEISWMTEGEFMYAQLIWGLDLILSRNPWWEYVTFSRLREELDKWSLIKGPIDLQQAVESAVAKGFYHLCIEEGEPPLCRKKYKYTMGTNTSAMRPYKEIPAMVLQTMRRLLQDNTHWHGVSFSKLLDELVDLTSKEVYEFNSSMLLDRQRLKDWCNFLVEIGFLHAFRGRSRAIDGDFREPPTLLRIVPEHPWIQWLDKDLTEAPESHQIDEDIDNPSLTALERSFVLRDLDYYRLIVIIEHYLHISNNDAVVAGWMPMSTLFHVMGRSLERAFCNAVVRASRDKEIIAIRTHDPRPGQHPARGAHIDLDHPLVAEARKRLLRCLEILQEVQDRDGTANLPVYEDRLRQELFLGENEDERLGWIDLMREENLIFVRTVPVVDSTDSTVKYQCSLNFRDRYVLVMLESLNPANSNTEGFAVQSDLSSLQQPPSYDTSAPPPKISLHDEDLDSAPK
jgi:hypothetical protein